MHIPFGEVVKWNRAKTLKQKNMLKVKLSFVDYNIPPAITFFSPIKIESKSGQNGEKCYRVNAVDAGCHTASFNFHLARYFLS